MNEGMIKDALVLLAYAGLALPGGHLLAGSVISTRRSMRILSMIGTAGCVLAFAVIVRAIDPT
jgi:hypothetical protein